MQKALRPKIHVLKKVQLLGTPVETEIWRLRKAKVDKTHCVCEYKNYNYIEILPLH